MSLTVCVHCMLTFVWFAFELIVAVGNLHGAHAIPSDLQLSFGLNSV